ncbi:hypothetical protein RAS1_38320 [Phycisphaerae bacterium RAS1]|nr:hypothetical protein RAS1_38320 [Phycisphaerae bacterium RAS1]
MRAYWHTLWIAAVLAALPAFGQSLPGYELIDITNTPQWFERDAQINNHGQIVFSRRMVASDDSTTEIMLWDNGALTQITNDNVLDDFPDINDSGTMVWSRGVGPNGKLEIVMWQDGALTQLTHDTPNDYGPRVNNAGAVVWYKYHGTGCGGAMADICLYDGVQVVTLVADGWSNQVPLINDAGDIVWTRFNFCTSPYSGDVYRYRDGVISRLSNSLSEPSVPALCSNGDVAWAQRKPPLYDWEIEIWRNGVIEPFAPGGGGVLLNSRGDIFFDRWQESNQTWQVWRWREGVFEQLTNGASWNWISDLADNGDFAWHSRDPFETDIRLLRRYPVGDLTCDGTVNVLDVNAFVLALASVELYSLNYPTCDAELADLNDDGQMNVLDINSFVARLAQGM